MTITIAFIAYIIAWFGLVSIVKVVTDKLCVDDFMMWVIAFEMALAYLGLGFIVFFGTLHL